MFSPANILHISNYDFEDGKSPSKNKYLLVIQNFDNMSIVVSLTSSKDYVPDSVLAEGCIKNDEMCIHCFHFPQDKVIGICGYSFAKNTYVYIERNIQTKEISHLKSKYRKDGGIQVKDKMLPEIYLEFLKCIEKGKQVPFKIKRSISQLILELSS